MDQLESFLVSLEVNQSKNIYRFDIFVIFYLWIQVFTVVLKLGSEDTSDFNLNAPLLFLIGGTGLFLLIFLFDVIYFKQRLAFKNRITPLFIAVILSSVISYTVNSRTVFIGGLSASLHVLLISLFIPAIALSCSSEKRVTNFLYQLNLFALFNTILVFITFLFPNLLSSLSVGEVSKGADGTRAFGIIGDQVGWILTFFSSYALFNKRWVLFGFYTIGIFMAATLGAIGLWGVVLIFFLWKYVKRTKNNIKIFAAASVPFLVLLLLSLGQLSKLTAVQRLTSGSIVDGAVGHRLMSYSLGVSNFIEKPILGYGFGTYSYINREKYGEIIDKGYETGISHTIFSNASNQYLQIAIDMGLIGLFIFIMFIKGIWIRTKLTKNYILKNIGVWCLVFILFNQTANWLSPGSYLWVFIAISIGLLFSEQANHKRY